MTGGGSPGGARGVHGQKRSTPLPLLLLEAALKAWVRVLEKGRKAQKELQEALERALRPPKERR
ncbi:hypothetical protein CSW45_02945 [Thermus scotoductus]|uniref:Uncharacterized protein n=1 Tax=Thermus scotoductus TaxID=37636 RepID=A0A430RE90_THESC|nr:hypothetical protein CSW45_02945 [Thermus scotoductus]